MALQDRLLHTRLPCPLNLILVNEDRRMKKRTFLELYFTLFIYFYPYPFQPVDLIVEQHLGVWQVDVAVVGVVEQMSEQSEVVPGMLGSLFGRTLNKDTDRLKSRSGKAVKGLCGHALKVSDALEDT